MAELRRQELVDQERKISDRRYAIKLVERIVFAAMGVIALYFLNKALGLFDIRFPQ